MVVAAWFIIIYTVVEALRLISNFVGPSDLEAPTGAVALLSEILGTPLADPPRTTFTACTHEPAFLALTDTW